MDDGSTDNTREVIEALSIQDDRIRYIHQENGERSNYLNFNQKSNLIMISLDENEHKSEILNLLKKK